MKIEEIILIRLHLNSESLIFNLKFKFLIDILLTTINMSRQRISFEVEFNIEKTSLQIKIENHRKISDFPIFD